MRANKLIVAVLVCIAACAMSSAEDFESWFTRNGGSSGPVELFRFPDGHFGMKAVRDIEVSIVLCVLRGLS